MRRITLIGKNGKGKYTLVDDADYEQASKFRWALDKDGYAQCGAIRLHRLILSDPTSDTVDHRNGNRLDNRRSNLRPATWAQNAQNRQPLSHLRYKGVTRAGRGHYRAVCCGVDLGRYPSKEDAAIAYNNAAIKRFGEFARLNSVEKP